MPAQTGYDPRLAAHAPSLPAPVSHEAPVVDDSAARIAGGIADAAKAVGPMLGRAYVAQKTAEIDDTLLGVQRRFAEWQAQYQQSNQGKLAMNAARDYVEYYDQLCDEAIREHAGPDHEVFGGLLRQRLAERGIYAARDGMAWQARQTEAWRASQEASQIDSLMRDAAADPYDVDRIRMEKDAVKGGMALRHPGIDLGAKFAELDEKTVIGMAESLLAKGDAQGLRQLFNQPLAMRGAPRPGSNSERNLSVWNYGNIKTKSGAFAAYGSMRDGLMAIGERLLRYHNAPERGWHAQTLRDVMNIYAPASENNTSKYAETLAAWMGVNPDERLDFDNPETIAAFIRNIPRYEHGQFAQIPQAEALAAAKALLAGERPQIAGEAPAAGRGSGGALALGTLAISPKQAQAYLAKADELERRQYALARDEMKIAIGNYIEAAKDGHIQDLPYSLEQLLPAFGESEGRQVWAKLTGARELAMDMAGAMTMTEPELEGLLAARSPDPQSPAYQTEAAYQQELARQIAGIRKRRQDDPALYVSQTNETAARARQAFLTSMNPQTARAYLAAMRSGLNAQGLADDALFSKADASLLAGWLSSADNPAEAAGKLAECFGADFPQAMRAISPGLSADAAVLASGMKAEPARLINEALRDKEFEKTHMELFRSDIEKKEFDEAANEKTDAIAKSFLGGGNAEIPLAIRRQTRLLALQYIRRLGLPWDQAIDRAYDEVIGERYEVAEARLPARAGLLFGKGEPAPGCRIPRSLDTEAVIRGLRAVIKEPPVARMLRGEIAGADPAEVDRTYARMVHDNAYWLTDSDDRGAVLFIGGNAVLDTNGQPFRMTWDELIAHGQQQNQPRLEPAPEPDPELEAD